ncbi:MAG: hypothetical protein E7040_03115 [Lentisphaerae bacterium]|nr:hypothetical protein [Lentisphaerota bacterium]
MTCFLKRIFIFSLLLFSSGLVAEHTIPTVKDRNAWKKLQNHPQWDLLVKLAENQRIQKLEDPFPYYMDFRNKGDRRSYQKRLNVLQDFGALTVVYCATKEKKYLAPIESRVRMLLDLPTWVLPAHYVPLNCQTGKTDVIDINAAIISGELAMLLHVLGPDMDPGLAARLNAELLRRIVIPWEQVLEGTHYVYDWMDRNDNWNAVCIAGCTGTFLMLDIEKQRKERLLELAIRKNNHFLQGFGNDGYCSEGISYWYYGFGHFLQFAETVKRYNGRNLLTADPRAERAAMFPERIRIFPGCYPMYADSSYAEKVFYLELRDILLGKRNGFSARTALNKNKQLSQLISILFSPRDERPADQSVSEQNTIFNQAQVYVARGNAECRLGVSFKGGHNREFHNHNDVGSYVVSVDGISLVLDPGTEVYTARTFSNRRYESRLIGSYGHNVPRIDGQEQTHLSGEPAVGFKGKNSAPPEATSAKILRQNVTADKLYVAMDLRAPYNHISGILKLDREFLFERSNGGRFTVTDSAVFEQEKIFEGAVITAGKIQKSGETRYRITQNGKSIVLELMCSEPVVCTVDLIKENTLGNRVFRRLSFRTQKKCRTVKMQFRYFPVK